MLMGDRQEQGNQAPEHLWFLVVSFFGRPHVSFAVSLFSLHLSICHSLQLSPCVFPFLSLSMPPWLSLSFSGSLGAGA